MCTYVHMHVLGGRLARAEQQRHITHDAAGRGAPHTTHCTLCTQFPKRQSYWLTCAAAGCSASSKGTHPMQERSLAEQSRSVAVAAPTRSTAHKIVACSIGFYQHSHTVPPYAGTCMAVSCKSRRCATLYPTRHCDPYHDIFAAYPTTPMQSTPSLSAP